MSSKLKTLAKRICAAKAKYRKAFADYISVVGPDLLAAREEFSKQCSHASEWEKWCRGKLGFSKQHANRLINAWEVMSIMEPIGSMMPTSESQCRQLAKVGKENVSDAWAAVVKRFEESDDDEITEQSIISTLRNDKRFAEYFAVANNDEQEPIARELYELLADVREAIWQAAQETPQVQLEVLVAVIRQELQAIEERLASENLERIA